MFLSHSWTCHQGSFPKFLISGQLRRKLSLGLLCLALGKQLTLLFIYSLIYLNLDLKTDTVSRSLVTAVWSFNKVLICCLLQRGAVWAARTAFTEQTDKNRQQRYSFYPNVTSEKPGFVHLAALTFPGWGTWCVVVVFPSCAIIFFLIYYLKKPLCLWLARAAAEEGASREC